MSGLAMIIEVAGGCVFAAGAAVAATGSYITRCKEENRARAMRLAAGAVSEDIRHEFLSDGMARRVLGYVVNLNRRLAVTGRNGAVGKGLERLLGERGRARLRTQLAQAGMADVREAACAQAAMRLAAMAAAAGLAVGGAVAPPLGVFCGMAAAIAGVSAPYAAVRRERAARAETLARELPEMLSVCALGLRSGLTFERSFRLYPQYVRTSFANSCEKAAMRMDAGLVTRAEAFEELASAYDSPLLARTLSSVDSSLIRGTSLVQDLERTADEARKQYRARKEQIVAKAPVKMMLPTGVFILPAMLLLVLGPVILGLVQGL